MPSGPNQKAITLSFSRKNNDIAEILKEYRKDVTFVQNDYVCEAIRFFEKYKDTIHNDIDKKTIEKLIDEKLEKFKEELFKNKPTLNTSKEESNYELLEKKAQELNDLDLEED